MPQKVIVETTTKMPELKTQKQSEKLPDVPSAAHVWPRDTRIRPSHSLKCARRFVDPCSGD